MRESSFSNQLAGLKLAAEESKKLSLNQLFEQDSERSNRFSFNLEGLHFDFSKTHINQKLLIEFERLADESGLLKQRNKLLAGGIVNPTEKRPALHADMRSYTPITADIESQRSDCYQYAERIREGEITPASGDRYRHIIHLGIGGSALGPQLLLDALAYSQNETTPAFDTHCIANIDGHALEPALQICDPNRTLVIIASKTFTTTETLSNANTIIDWIRANGVEKPYSQLVAVTASPDKAKAFGILEEHILTFPEGLGGRYSIWSSVSLAAMINIGTSKFESMRLGANKMDTHFAQTPIQENIPIIAAMLDIWYCNTWDAPTRAIFAYDSRLNTLVNYLQQLEMENNGKSVSSKGENIEWQSSPILWGGIGTDAQHAVFQLMHQGTHLTPVEFLAVIKAEHSFENHHKCLLANCFAQSAALMKGRTYDEAEALLDESIQSPEERDLLASSKTFSGNRPSTTILLDELSPELLGMLIAFYEHRSFVSGTLWQINVFDQMGVELGKELAKKYQRAIETGDTSSISSELDKSTERLLNLALK